MASFIFSLLWLLLLMPHGVPVLTPCRLTQEEKDAFLDEHNTLRSQSGAADMWEMVWDDDLADYAQTWADNCILDHDQPPEAPSDLGQNLFGGSGLGGISDVAGVVVSWHNEIGNYDLATTSCSGTCGHYTQVVWSNSKRLGCAYQTQCSPMYWDAQLTELWNSGKIVVCNYDPGGNFHNTAPFSVGTACSECEGDFCCTEKGLCRDGSCDGDPVVPTDPPMTTDVIEDEVTTVPPATVSPPSAITTTTTATPTATTVVPLDPCQDGCSNGGTLDPQNCVCDCADGWQGDTCEENSDEVEFGFYIYLPDRVLHSNTWSSTWLVIQLAVASAVDNYCRHDYHVASCCGFTVSSGFNAADLTYTSASDVLLGTGSPYLSMWYGQSVTRALIIVQQAADATLCDAARSATRRRKRALDLSNALPQDVLLASVTEAESDIAQALLDCCDVTLLGIEAGEVPSSSRQGYGTLVLGVVAVVAVFAIPALAFLCYSSRSQKRHVRRRRHNKDRQARAIDGNDASLQSRDKVYSIHYGYPY